jgi:hypothetical protein
VGVHGFSITENLHSIQNILSNGLFVPLNASLSGMLPALAAVVQ